MPSILCLLCLMHVWIISVVLVNADQTRTKSQGTECEKVYEDMPYGNRIGSQSISVLKSFFVIGLDVNRTEITRDDTCDNEYWINYHYSGPENLSLGCYWQIPYNFYGADMQWRYKNTSDCTLPAKNLKGMYKHSWSNLHLLPTDNGKIIDCLIYMYSIHTSEIDNDSISIRFVYDEPKTTLTTPPTTDAAPTATKSLSAIRTTKLSDTTSIQGLEKRSEETKTEQSRLNERDKELTGVGPSSDIKLIAVLIGVASLFILIITIVLALRRWRKNKEDYIMRETSDVMYENLNSNPENQFPPNTESILNGEETSNDINYANANFKQTVNDLSKLYSTPIPKYLRKKSDKETVRLETEINEADKDEVRKSDNYANYVELDYEGSVGSNKHLDEYVNEPKYDELIGVFGNNRGYVNVESQDDAEYAAPAYCEVITKK